MSTVTSEVAGWLGRVTASATDGDLDEGLELYAEDVVFRDPMQETRGKASFRDVCRSLADRSRELRFEVRSFAEAGGAGFIAWRMIFVPRVGPRMDVDGVTVLAIDGGKVTHHTDYWDFVDLAASSVPWGRGLVRRMMRPFV